MILSNTVATSVVLNGATSTVNTPADTLAPLGFGVVSNGENWRGWPGPNQPVVPAVTATATTNLDWSQGGLFQVNYPATTLAVTFTFTNVQVGQTIQMWSKQGPRPHRPSPGRPALSGTAAARVSPRRAPPPSISR